MKAWIIRLVVMAVVVAAAATVSRDLFVAALGISIGITLSWMARAKRTTQARDVGDVADR